MWEPKDRTVLMVIGILLLFALLDSIDGIMRGIGSVIGGMVAVLIFSWPVLVWILFVLGSLLLLWIAVRVVKNAWRD